jgi:hypothetical protein
MRFLVIVVCVMLAALVVSGCATVSNADDGASGLAQPRTRVPGGAGRPTPEAAQRPTLPAAGAQATAQALATAAADQVGGAPGAAETAQAVLDSAANSDANPDAVVATAQAFATQSAVNMVAVEATVSAIMAAAPLDWYADYDLAELQQIFTSWLATGSVSLVHQGDSLSATVTYTETGLNAVLDAALMMGVYPVSDVNVNLVPGGALVDLYGFTIQSGQTGMVSLYLTLTAVGGRVEIELESASFNGRTLPVERLDSVEVVLDDLSAAINDLLALTYGLDYRVDALAITDVDFTATLTVLGLPEM